LPTPLFLSNGLLVSPAREAVSAIATTFKGCAPRDFFTGFLPPYTARIGRFRDGMAKRGVPSACSRRDQILDAVGWSARPLVTTGLDDPGR
jgi:hypothetical protein